MHAKRIALLTVLSTFVLGLGSAAWGFLIEPGWVRLNHLRIETHRWPAVFFDVPSRAVATLAGHMHGGQVYLPFLGALITPGRAPARFAYGHIREDGKDLYVTAGLGTSILPVRFNMPPEIAILTIASP